MRWNKITKSLCVRYNGYSHQKWHAVSHHVQWTAGYRLLCNGCPLQTRIYTSHDYAPAYYHVIYCALLAQNEKKKKWTALSYRSVLFQKFSILALHLMLWIPHNRHDLHSTRYLKTVPTSNKTSVSETSLVIYNRQWVNNNSQLQQCL